MVHLDDDPSLMSPEQRLRAIAALLVHGFQRFKAKGAGSMPSPPPRSPLAASQPKDAAHDCH